MACKWDMKTGLSPLGQPHVFTDPSSYQSGAYSSGVILRLDRHKKYPHGSRRVSTAISHYERLMLLSVRLKNSFGDEQVWTGTCCPPGACPRGGKTCPPTGGLHLIPYKLTQILDIRVWYKNQMLQSTTLPLEGIRVHI